MKRSLYDVWHHPEALQALPKITVDSDKILTGQLPNTNQKLYRLCQLYSTQFFVVMLGYAFAAWRLSE
jgi:hypothetical protein